MYEGYETLEITRDGGILTVAFNRPEVRNATNPTMHRELERIFPEIGRDPDANVVILTGRGKCFSAGGDIKQMQKSVDDRARWIEAMAEAKRILEGLLALDRPIIAKVNGHAIGLGATLALFCDITVADVSAKIADPHVKVGLVAGDGGAIIWPALIGYARAKKYLFTGEAITGREAAEIGLISEAVESDALDARVDAIAAEINAGAAQAIRLTKRSVNLGLRAQVDALLDAHLGFETMSYLTDDHREAVNAFAEGRTPVFKGR